MAMAGCGLIRAWSVNLNGEHNNTHRWSLWNCSAEDGYRESQDEVVWVHRGGFAYMMAKADKSYLGGSATSFI